MPKPKRSMKSQTETYKSHLRRYNREADEASAIWKKYKGTKQQAEFTQVQSDLGELGVEGIRQWRLADKITSSGSRGKFSAKKASRGIGEANLFGDVVQVIRGKK